MYRMDTKDRGKEDGMNITSSDFGLANGKQVKMYTMQNKKGMKVEILNFGGIIRSICIPKGGKMVDVVLGYDTIEPYISDVFCFGALIGRNANRIKNAAFTLDGISYTLEQNEKGNNLHSSHMHGYHKRIWNVECDEEQNRLILTLDSPDMDQGFPGNCKIKVEYALAEDNSLEVQYEAVSDKKTVFNMTNHVYLNLKGHDGGDIYSHQLLIKAPAFTEIEEDCIPTGKIIPVAGTPMDFNRPHKVGEFIGADDEQIKRGNGYDHNWVLAKETSGIEKVAEMYEESTGIRLEVFTDRPGVQFYAGNGLDSIPGKNGAVYNKCEGFCLETQFYPNSVNEPTFPSPVIGADTMVRSTTVYKFIY